MSAFSNNNRWFQIGLPLSVILLIICGSSIQALQKAIDSQKHRHTKERAIMDITRQYSILTQINKEAYQNQRNELLGHPTELTNLIATHASSADWADRIHASILKGWLQYRELYLSILKELDAVNPEKESKTIVGISRIWDAYALKAKNEYGHAVLPLAWEVILKFESYWPDWKIITFLRMIAAVPDVQSIEPVIWLLERTDNIGLRQVAGNTLADLPEEAVTNRIKQLSERLENIRQVIDDTLYEMK